MRTALVLTGHMRAWELAFPSIKEQFLDKYNPDVYIYTWSNRGYWVDPKNDPKELGVIEDEPIDRIDVKFAYKPKFFQFLPTNTIVRNVVDNMLAEYPIITEKCGEIRPKNIMFQFLFWQSALQEMEAAATKENIEYDLVIRTRPDIIWHKPFPDMLPENLYTVRHPNHTGHGTGDMFFAGGQNCVMPFAKTFNQAPYLTKLNNRFCPHMFMTSIIDQFGLSWVELDIPKTIMHTPIGQYMDYRTGSKL